MLLRLSAHRAAAQLVPLDGPSLPRFDTSVDVEEQSPQTALEQRLHVLDLRCGPPSTGAPTALELRRFMPGVAPSVDFTQLAAGLANKIKRKGGGRYVLYRVTHAGAVSYLLRDGPLPEAWHHNLPDAVYEELGRFPDVASGASALHRMEQGFASPTRTTPGEPPPSWATSTCSPAR